MSTDSRHSSKRHGSRFRARGRAVELLYEAETRDLDPVALVEDRIPLGRREGSGVRPVADYTVEIVRGVAVELNALDDAIDTHLQEGWSIDRIPAVERAILRVVGWELLFNPDVPAKVAFKEGAELAVQYSSDTAPKYIHAVLDAIHRETERAEKVKEMTVQPDAEPDLKPNAPA